MQKEPENVLDRVGLRLQAALAKGVSVAESLRANERTRIPNYVAAKLAREYEIRGAISESCAEWVKTGRFPLMASEDALFFYDRLFYAFGLVRVLSETGFSWPGEEEKLLLWLLIDSWERINCLQWKFRLENPS